MKKQILTMFTGLFIGAIITGGASAYAAGILAERSNHRIFVDGQEVQMEAYGIAGHNYVKLRDIGKAVGFNVFWDADSGCVQIETDAPYTGEAPSAEAVPPAAPSDVDAAKQDTVHDVTLEYPGQIIKLSAYDKPASLGVTITKRGNAQVMAGQSMRYDLTVANTSNVPLESFFWHDKIPYDVARPTTLTTGTYSARLNYRILYKTNCNTSYQVLASNLLTSNNYSFSLNAIPMQAGEVVTDIYFDFGTVPVGFQSVANPTLSVMVKGMAVNGYQMVNRADAGGKYQGTWQTATANWITIVRKIGTTPKLPKTGY